MEDNDALLQLKKRARRRLVGAVFLVGSAVFVLSMTMKQEPPRYLEGQQEPKVVIPGQDDKKDPDVRIPGHDEKPFAPRFAAAPALSSVATPQATVTTQKSVTTTTQKPVEPVQKPVEKPAVKPQEKPVVQKPAEKPAEKPADTADSQRAAAILAGKLPEAANAGGQHVILIGAFANQANVKNLQTKLGQLGIKVYTEPLDSPQGKKIRVRAGPFPTREAGEKALEKMKRIGVSGVLTAKQ